MWTAKLKKNILFALLMHFCVVYGCIELTVKHYPENYKIGEMVNFTCSAEKGQGNLRWYQIKGNSHIFHYGPTISISIGNGNITSIYCLCWSRHKTNRYAIMSNEIELTDTENTGSSVNPDTDDTVKIEMFPSKLIIGESVNFTCTPLWNSENIEFIELHQQIGKRLNLLSGSGVVNKLVFDKKISICDNNTYVYCDVFYTNGTLSYQSEDFTRSKKIHLIIKDNPNLLPNDNNNCANVQTYDGNTLNSTVNEIPVKDSKNKDKDKKTDKGYLILTIAASAGSLIVLAIVLQSIYCIYKHRRTRPEVQETNNVYVTDTVLYADVEVTPTRQNNVPRTEQIPYAQIIGVLKPKQ